MNTILMRQHIMKVRNKKFLRYYIPILGADANMDVFFADEKDLLYLKNAVRNTTTQLMNFVTMNLSL